MHFSRYTARVLPRLHAFLSCGLAMLVCVSYAFFVFTISVPDSWASGPKQTESDNLIEVARSARVVRLREQEAFAQVVSLNASRLAVEAQGVVRHWYADVGSRVRQGEPLLLLDDRDAQLMLSQAQALAAAARARLGLAEAQVRRAEELVAKGFFSQEALLQRETERVLAQSESATAQAQENLAKRALDKTILRAPFDGIVLERFAQQGETLAAGAPAFVFSDPAAVEIEASLSAEQVQSLRAGHTPRLRWAGGLSDLRLLRISEVAMMPSRTQTVRLGVTGSQRPMAGATGQLVWSSGQPEIPPSVIVRRQQGLGVFVLVPAAQGYTVRFVLLPLAEEGRPALLEKHTGLRDQSLVVVRGQDSLQDGQQIDAARVRVQP